MDRLGRLSHSTQDFFLHAIRKDGQGENENSSFPGWGAWRHGYIGTPDNTANFWPSSYHLVYTYEHPPIYIGEPILDTSPEWPLRWNAAVDYTLGLYTWMLQLWIGSGAGECFCYCRTSLW